jgi:hypothetical protein
VSSIAIDPGRVQLEGALRHGGAALELQQLARRPDDLRKRSARARDRTLRYFSRGAKAEQVLEAYQWVLGERANRPDFGIPLGVANGPGAPVEAVGEVKP